VDVAVVVVVAAAAAASVLAGVEPAACWSASRNTARRFSSLWRCPTYSARQR
jgi:hypothetical protein